MREWRSCKKNNIKPEGVRKKISSNIAGAESNIEIEGETVSRLFV
jgi:hypothetical protein